MADRTLPPGDYGYVQYKGCFCPVRVVGRRGLLWTRVALFKPYDGTKAMRVLTRRIIGVEDGNALLAFKADPLAVLHMTGDTPAVTGAELPAR